MTRDRLIQALSQQSPDDTVELEIAGWFFTLAGIRTNQQRGTIVLEVFQVGENPAQSGDRRWRALPKTWGEEVEPPTE